MKNELPCYIVSDLLPLYQDNLLSEQTKADIDAHISECPDCKNKMTAMEMKINLQPAQAQATASESKDNKSTDVKDTASKLQMDPLKKVRFYQKAMTALGAVIAFILGASCPIAFLGLLVLDRGQIAAYQVDRVKKLWYIIASWSLMAGVIVCVVYLLILLLIRRLISK